MKKLLGILLVIVLSLSTLVSCDYVLPYLDEFLNNEDVNDSNEPERTYYIPVKAEITSSYGTATVILEYGENDLVAKKTQLMGDEIHQTVEYSYNSDNKLIKFVQVRDGEEYSTTEYTYGSNGLASNVTLSNGPTVTNVYNADGRLIETFALFQNMKLYDEYYTYDQNGKVSESKYYSTGNDCITTTYSYDSEGKPLQVVSDNGLKYTYTYDSNGVLIKVVGPGIILPSENGGEFTYNLTYDSNGNIAKVEVTNTAGEEYTCTFEYKEGTPSHDIEINRHASVEALFSNVAEVLLFYSVE